MITKLDAATDVLVPLPDPPERTDMNENRVQSPTYVALKSHFGKRADVVCVEGYGYLLVRAQGIEDWSLHFYPDVIVAFEVDAYAIAARNGYVISEVGKPPDFVMEVASESTAERDETVKREGYAEMRGAGVLEIRRFSKRSLCPAAGRRHSGGRFLPAGRVDDGTGR